VAGKADEDWRDNSHWKGHFRIGMELGFNIQADFSAPPVLSVANAQVGAPGVSGVDHVYDDGYVRVDNTGNAQGYTSYWGYNNSSQYDQATTLTFHSGKSISLAESNRRADDPPYIGFEMAYGGEFAHWKKAWVGWEAGFGLLP